MALILLGFYITFSDNEWCLKKLNRDDTNSLIVVLFMGLLDTVISGFILWLIIK
jgi:hypothetical protein